MNGPLYTSYFLKLQLFFIPNVYVVRCANRHSSLQNLYTMILDVTYYGDLLLSTDLRSMFILNDHVVCTMYAYSLQLNGY